jgi:hypothetical protein
MRSPRRGRKRTAKGPSRSNRGKGGRRPMPKWPCSSARWSSQARPCPALQTPPLAENARDHGAFACGAGEGSSLVRGRKAWLEAD